MAFTNARLGKKDKKEIIETVSQKYGEVPTEPGEKATVAVETEKTEIGEETVKMVVAGTKYDVQTVKVAVPDADEKDYPSVTILANPVPSNE